MERLSIRKLHLTLTMLILGANVLMMNACGSGSSGSTDNASNGGAATALAAPAGMTVTSGDAQVTVNWPPVAAATSYNLYWKQTAGVTTADAKIANISSPYVHANRTNGTNYYYAVTAVNAAGESPVSNEASAKPQYNITTGTAVISGTVQPDPADTTATGKNTDATVYVIGQQNNAAKTDSNGNYNLKVDATLSGTVSSSPSFFGRLINAFATPVAKTYGLVVISSGSTHGRKTEVQVTDNQVNTASTIYVNTVGSISGKAMLYPEPSNHDHTGIMVYIPGTSFLAMTAADGSYVISNVPSGTYDVVRAEKLGSPYLYALVSNIKVVTNAATKLPDMLLQLSAGPNGNVLINNGASFSSSNTVNLAIVGGSAVSMQVSQDINFTGQTWEPFQAARPYTFTGDYSAGGAASVYVKFLDANGTPSSPIAASIYIDTNPLASQVSPLVTTASAKPDLSWDYPHQMANIKFHLQASTSSDFKTTLVDATNLSATHYTLTSLLANHGVYYWHVAIIDGSGTEWGWSPTWSFTVNMSAVTLQYPTHLSYCTSSPTFSWLPNINAATYALAVSTNKDLSNPIASITGIQGTHYALALGQTPSTTYNWAVTPVDANSLPGVSSDTWAFTLDSVAPIITNNTFSINGGAATVYSTAVTLHIEGSDTNGTGIAAYYVSENAAQPAVGSNLWVALNIPVTQLVVDISYKLSSGNTQKTLYLWLKDQAGNISASASQTTTLAGYITSTVDSLGGNVGLLPSIALDSLGRPHIAYMDAVNGHLNHAKQDVLLGWVPETVDPLIGVNSGLESISLAIDKADHVHVMYYDTRTNPMPLKYANNISGSWQSWTLDPLTSTGVGAMTLDSKGNVHIAYQSATWDLLYTTNATGSWATTTVIAGAPGNHLYEGYYPSITADKNNAVHISYTEYYSYGGDFSLMYATNATGTWAVSGVDGGAWVRSTSIKADSRGWIHIGYGDFQHSALKYAVWGQFAGSWVTNTIDDPSVSTGGTFYPNVSLALDAGDNVHMSYYDIGIGHHYLKYITNAYGAWRRDAPVTQFACDDIGKSNSIAVDQTTGKVHIGYYNWNACGGGGSLKYVSTP